MLNKDHLPILKCTRELIETGVFTYICNAAEIAGIRLNNWSAADDVIAAIRAGLCDGDTRRHSLNIWLGAQLGVRWTQLDDDMLRLARLAWLDRLIYDLENCHETADV